METKIIFRKKKFGIALLLILLSGIGALGYIQAENTGSYKDFFNNTSKIDSRSNEILKELSWQMKALKEFSFVCQGYYEVLSDTGSIKIQLTNKSKVAMKRPGKLKGERVGEDSDIEFYIDGKKFFIYGKSQKYYSSVSVSPDIDSTLDLLKEKLNVYLPASDLLYTNVYEGIMEEVTSGFYVGKGIAGNVVCDHIALQGKNVDVQLWIQEEKRLPRKYVITSKNIPGMPQYGVEIIEWNLVPQLKDKDFVFKVPKEANKVDFLGLSKNEVKVKK